MTTIVFIKDYIYTNLKQKLQLTIGTQNKSVSRVAVKERTRTSNCAHYCVLQY